jgi:hypothetical protein
LSRSAGSVFKPEDIKIIINGHGHSDHAGAFEASLKSRSSSRSDSTSARAPTMPVEILSMRIAGFENSQLLASKGELISGESCCFRNSAQVIVAAARCPHHAAIRDMAKHSPPADTRFPPNYYRQDSMFDPPVKNAVPTIFNLYTEPREEKPTLDTWVVHPIYKMVSAFEDSVKKHPLIPMGTPDPNVPPASRR